MRFIAFVIGGTTVLLTRILWSTFAPPGRAWHVVSACTFLSVVCIYSVAWNSRKPFLQDLFSVRAGMTASEVHGVMKGYIRGTRWSTPPYGRYAQDNLGQLAVPKAVVYRHSTLAAYNADWGIVTFSSGRVVRVEFSAD